jgi:hypothetical protein
MIFKCGSKKKSGKRYLALAIFLVAVFMASVALASDGGITRLNANQEVLTYVCVNTSAVAAANTNISTSTITTQNHRILGFTVQEYDPTAAAERIVGLYDCDSDLEITTTYIFDEAETSDNVSYTRWYPYPKALSQGLTVQQGANTVVIIYYEDIRTF